MFEFSEAFIVNWNKNKEDVLGIYNLPARNEDELYTSHLFRTAAVNGFAGEEEFFIDNQVFGGSSMTKNIGTEMNIPFTRYASLLSIDPVKAFREMTLFNVLSPLTNPNRLQCMISEAFYNPGYRCKVPHTTYQTGKKNVKVCPECARSEIKELGYYWLHRKHNVPGINVCPEHHCRLMEIEYT